MLKINMHEAKTQLSRLVERAVAGESFIIAKAGTPLVKVTRMDAPPSQRVKRLGFLKNQLTIPADFDQITTEEIARLFEGQS